MGVQGATGVVGRINGGIAMRKLIIITVLMMLIFALLAGCQGQAKDGTEPPSATGPLSLQISSPRESWETSWGFVTVAGIVSPPQAKVNVNGISVDVAEDGSFESDYILLNEGKNELRAVATANGKTVSKIVTVNYTLKLHVSISLNFEPSRDWFTESPAEIGGRVSDPRAEVIVNGKKAEVGKDGYISVMLELAEGANQITATAKLGDQIGTDTREAIYVPLVPLTLSVASPEDGGETGIDLAKVTGTVSDPEAVVIVSNTRALPTASGAFYAYVELEEGQNRIDIVATRGSESVTDTIYTTYNPATTQVGTIALAVSSPQSNTEYKVNLLPVTGKVDNPAATVLVSGREAIVSEDGSFQGYAVLEEGENDIRVVAVRDSVKTATNIMVTFTQALVIHLDYPSVTRETDYTKEPMIVNGKVNYPRATVTVNGLVVAVAPDGSFTAQEKLKEGSNSIKAVATLGDEQDEVYILFMVENGYPNPVPGYSIFFHASLDYEHKIILKAGETKRLPLTLKTKKDGPGRFSGRLVRVDREYGLIPQPMPEGLDVYLEPSEFLAYPNATYNSNLVFKTTAGLALGTYYLHFYHNLEKGFNGSGWIEVTVE